MSFSESSKSTFVHNPGERPGFHCIRGSKRSPTGGVYPHGRRSVAAGPARPLRLRPNLRRNEEWSRNHRNAAEATVEARLFVTREDHIGHYGNVCNRSRRSQMITFDPRETAPRQGKTLIEDYGEVWNSMFSSTESCAGVPELLSAVRLAITRKPLEPELTSTA